MTAEGKRLLHRKTCTYWKQRASSIIDLIRRLEDLNKKKWESYLSGSVVIYNLSYYPKNIFSCTPVRDFSGKERRNYFEVEVPPRHLIRGIQLKAFPITDYFRFFGATFNAKYSPTAVKSASLPSSTIKLIRLNFEQHRLIRSVTSRSRALLINTGVKPSHPPPPQLHSLRSPPL